MKMGYESATRRNFILASSAQIAFAFKSDVAFGQSPPTDLSQIEKDSMDQLVKRFNFVLPSDFIRVFWTLFGEKVGLTLAIVNTDIREALNELLIAVRDELLKEYGGDIPIPRDNLHLVLAGAIYVQNVIFAISTDMKTGIITITNDQIQKAKSHYCSFYPHCK